MRSVIAKHMDGSIEMFDLLHYDKYFIHIIFHVFFFNYFFHYF